VTWLCISRKRRRKKRVKPAIFFSSDLRPDVYVLSEALQHQQDQHLSCDSVAEVMSAQQRKPAARTEEASAPAATAAAAAVAAPAPAAPAEPAKPKFPLSSAERKKLYRWTGDEPLWLVIFMKYERVCVSVLSCLRTLHIITALSVVAFFWTLIAVLYLRTDPWRIPTQAFLRLDRWWYDVPVRAITKVQIVLTCSLLRLPDLRLARD
jgi:hypothetical protein